MEQETNGKGLRARLEEMAEERYRLFQQTLCPGVEDILGVRLPLLRSLAGEIAKGDWRGYLEQAGDGSYEEVMLQGMVIGRAQMGLEERLRRVAAFVPKIGNWAVCDSFCASLKLAPGSRERVWEFLQPYLASREEFSFRFGVVMLLDHFVVEEYLQRVLHALNRRELPGYYAQMAVAWAVSRCYVAFPEESRWFLEENRLDDFTHNKAIQKILESRRCEPQQRDRLRQLRR